MFGRALWLVAIVYRYSCAAFMQHCVVVMLGT